jgi:hypothetical protein
MSGCNCVRVDESNNEPLEYLLRHSSPIVPELPHEMALDVLRQKYIDFAQQTKLLVAAQNLPIQKGVRDYTLEAPDGYQVFGVLNMEDLHNGFVQFPNVDRWFYTWGRRFELIGNKLIRLFEEPTRDDTHFPVGLHLIPTQCVDTIPTDIATPFGYGIAMGVVAHALNMPGKAWYNPQMGRKMEIEFSRAKLRGQNLYLTNRGARTPQFRPVRIL